MDIRLWGGGSQGSFRLLEFQGFGLRTASCVSSCGFHGVSRGSIYTTTMMESGSQNQTKQGFWGPSSIMVVFMDPLGLG